MQITALESQRKKKKNWEGKKLFLLILPFLILSFLFSYFPLHGWIYALYDYRAPLKLLQCEFVGLKWFKTLFSNPTQVTQLVQVMKNTFAMSLLGIATSFLPVLFAVFLNEIKCKWFKNLVQTFTTLPNFISWTLVYSVAFCLFSSSGMLNTVLQNLGWISEPLKILDSGEHVWLQMLLWNTWKGLGWGAIMYLAALAGEYDTVIYIGGLNHDHDSEGNDRADMKLPYEQDLLIRELLEVRPDMIVVLLAGSPVEMGAWIDQADTLLWGWYAGTEGGNALADVLLGAVNPSGKLPETFYKKHTDCSAHAVGTFAVRESVSYKEGVYVGYRYNEKQNIQPQFPFGYGLSYTTFAYRDMQTDDAKHEVSCYVKNTGSMDGAEIVEVYRLAREGEDAPVKELKGFEKVYLKAGEEKKVFITVEEEPEHRDYVIGSSLTDIRLTAHR